MTQSQPDFLKQVLMDAYPDPEGGIGVPMEDGWNEPTTPADPLTTRAKAFRRLCLEAKEASEKSKELNKRVDAERYALAEEMKLAGLTSVKGEIDGKPFTVYTQAKKYVGRDDTKATTQDIADIIGDMPEFKDFIKPGLRATSFYAEIGERIKGGLEVPQQILDLLIVEDRFQAIARS